jgi:energy-coupling factor transport system substrate-specific component
MQKNKSTLSVRLVVAIGIGTAIIVLLKRFVSIPTGFPNTNIDISYGVLGFFAALFGPVAGFLIGFLGHAISDAMGGMPWWSWVLATGIVGLIIGFFKNKLNVESGDFGVKKIVLYNVAQVIANAISWLLVAPTLDVLIYSEPANKVYVQGAIATVSNAVAAGVIGTILLVAYAATRTKAGSLKKAD